MLSADYLMTSISPRATYHSSSLGGRRTRGGLCFLWFAGGCLFGLVGGVLLVLALATLASTRVLPFVTDPSPGNADIVVSVDEDYLNSQIAQRVNGSYATGIDGLTLTALKIDLNPDNRMDLLPTFHEDTGFFLSFDVNARVNNRIGVQNDGLFINMVGDPQLGDLNISLDVLPFDLKGTIHQAIDNLNNGLLISEINNVARPSLESANFTLDSVATDDNALTVRLKQK